MFHFTQRIILIIIFVILNCSVLINTENTNVQSNVSAITNPEFLHDEVFHWYPYQRIMYKVTANGDLEKFCKPPGSSIDEFPQFFTTAQRLQGLIALHFLVALYLFIVLAFICDKYFIPSVERICLVLNISPDVAASTFMATATSMPEFFNNTISVFLAESDMGLGAIVGSMLFNTLGVGASASLFTKKPIQMDWFGITRDSILFSCNIGVLVTIVWDGVIMWYETIVFVVLYILYWMLMFQNPRIMKFVKGVVEDRWLWCQRIKNYDIVNQRPKEIAVSSNGSDNKGFSDDQEISTIEKARRARSQSFDINAFDPPAPGERRKSFDLSRIDEIEEEDKLYELPRDASAFDYFWFFFTWPIRFLLHYTIPNPVKYKKWFVATFVLCIVWIAMVAYVIFWMVVVIGYTFGIPEPIMGFTLLAFGGCMPEAISAVIVARKGSGQMGVSNALGANNLNILFSLGIPWFIRNMATGAIEGFQNSFVQVEAIGIQYTILGLLLAIASLYLTISAFGYKMRKTVGAILITFYLIYATIAILLELDIIFPQTREC